MDTYEQPPSGFTGLDWSVLLAYFVLLAVTGVWLSRRQSSTRDYFLGGGRIPAWAAAVSFLATALSAATFVGGPQQSFRGDLTYLSANIGSLLAVLVVALFFIPAFFRERVATVYELLGRRFGPGAAQAAGGAFLLGRVFASGARLYIAALPASLIVFGDLKLEHLLAAIAVLTAVGIVYTYVGGIRAVIWTDVVQTGVFVGAALAALAFLLGRIPAGVGDIINLLSHPAPGEPSKLKLLQFGLDGFGPKHAYTLLTAVFGFTLLNIGAYGTDQDMAQRALTCRSALKGSLSAVSAVIVGLPVTALFMAIGLLLYIFYTRPELMGAAMPGYIPAGSRQIFLTFIIREMPPGLTGLMLAGLFAAGLSSLNSAVNAMSSTLVNDFYRKFRPDVSDAAALRVGRLGVAVCGVLLGGFAAFSALWQEARPDTTLIDFALLVMVFAYSGLTAVFLAAIFTRRGGTAGVVAALVTGFGAVLVMQWRWAAVLAFPWQMLIATAAAFAVCVAFPARRLEQGDERRRG